jgi:hypothetical protein
MERIVKLSEEFIDTKMDVDPRRAKAIIDAYRTQLLAAIVTLNSTDLICLAVVLVQGPGVCQ